MSWAHPATVPQRASPAQRGSLARPQARMAGSSLQQQHWPQQQQVGRLLVEVALLLGRLLPDCQ